MSLSYNFLKKLEEKLSFTKYTLEMHKKKERKKKKKKLKMLNLTI